MGVSYGGTPIDGKLHINLAFSCSIGSCSYQFWTHPMDPTHGHAPRPFDAKNLKGHSRPSKCWSTYAYDGLSKCLFPVLLINRNSMRAASCLPLKLTWKCGNFSLPLEIFLKPQESANARRFSFAVAGTISWTVCLCVCASLNAICFLTCLLINAVSLL